MVANSPYVDRSVNALATSLPGAAAMFRRCGIAVCRDGERPLREAVAASALSLRAVIGALEDLEDAAGRGTPAETEALIAHVVTRYHDRHRIELPQLIGLAAALERGAGRRPGAPQGLADLLDGLLSSLEDHMRKEELRVFPMMRRGCDARIGEALAVLRDEHDDTLDFLLGLERATGGYHAPPCGDPRWGRLYEDLERLMDDVVAHIHIEDALLFPRFETQIR